MTAFTIDDLEIPTTLDGLAGDDLRATYRVSTIVRSEIVGAAEGTVTAEEEFPRLRDQQEERVRIFVARVQGEIVGNAFVEWSTEEGSRVTWLDLEVLYAWRNQGIGSALFDRMEQIARESGRPITQGGALHEAISTGDRLASATGFGTIPLDDPGARFLLNRGYTLEQIHRRSSLALPLDEQMVASHLDTISARHDPGYRLHTWVGPVPKRWQSDVATLLARLRTDAPYGDLEMDEEVWDAARVERDDARALEAGKTSLAAVVEHVPTKTLVAFNGLTLQEDRLRPAQQGTTLVVKEHRGHRLGLWVKVTNIVQLMQTSPQTPAIVTSNAEDNRSMLVVNEALGFTPVGYIGAWKKEL